jgi:hypothetical protein
MSIHLHVEAINGAELRGQLSSMLDYEPVPPSPLTLPAAFGAKLQGGIYVGPHFNDNGTLGHLIAADEDLGEHTWEDAKTHASEYDGGGFDDWFLPEKAHLMIAQIYAKDVFEKGYHWSATPCGSGGAWVVGFEHGRVHTRYRYREFRVRPFRRFIY